MTQAVTAVRAYVREIDEPTTNRFWQHLVLETTGANTDTAYDFGLYVAGSLGTFWTAVGTDGSFGQTALGLMQSIATLYKTTLSINSPALTSRTGVGAGGIQVLTSATIGTGTAVTATVTGLLSTDVILAVTQSTDNANGVAPTGFGSPAADALPITYHSTSGANGKVTVAFYRPTGTITVSKGQYGIVNSNDASNITFASGDAPTTATWVFSWELAAGCHGVKLPTN